MRANLPAEREIRMTAKEIITKFHSIGDAELSLADTQWLIKNIDDAIREAQRQVSVEPEVKVQIAEIIDKLITGNEIAKLKYLDKNPEMYIRCQGGITSLNILKKKLQESNLSA
jgi:hypothetical protein